MSPCNQTGNRSFRRRLTSEKPAHGLRHRPQTSAFRGCGPRPLQLVVFLALPTPESPPCPTPEPRTPFAWNSHRARRFMETCRAQPRGRHASVVGRRGRRGDGRSHPSALHPGAAQRGQATVGGPGRYRRLIAHTLRGAQLGEHPALGRGARITRRIEAGPVGCCRLLPHRALGLRGSRAGLRAHGSEPHGSRSRLIAPDRATVPAPGLASLPARAAFHGTCAVTPMLRLSRTWNHRHASWVEVVKPPQSGHRNDAGPQS